jgi:tape measure domain-containing protein
MATEIRRVRIELKGEGTGEIRKLAKSFSELSDSSQKTAGVLTRAEKSFNNLFFGVLGGVGIKALTDTADRFQLLRDRIKVFEGAGAEETFNKLTEAAQFTKTPVSDLAQSYSRLSLALGDLGVSSDAVVGLTVALQQSFRLSGSTASEATAAIIQLSQGLASGQLRGQELRSVLEQNVIVGGLLSKQLGVSRGQLIKFAESGKITSQVVLKALAGSIDTLNKQAEGLGQTFGQTVSIAFDRFGLQIDKINSSLGVSSAFAKGIEFLLDNFDLLASAIVLIVSAAYLPSLITGFLALTKAVVGLNLAVVALKGLLSIGVIIQIIISPIFLVTAALSALAAGITFLALNWETAGPKIAFYTGLILEKILEFRIGLLGLAETISRSAGLDSLADIFKENSDRLKVTLEDTRGGLEALRKQIAENEKKSDGGGLGKAFEALKDAPNTLKVVGSGADKLTSKIAALNNAYKANRITLEQYNDSLRKLRIGEANKQFKEGQKDLEAYNNELDKINNSGALEELNRKFAANKITVTEFNVELNKLELSRLREGVRNGTTSVLELNKAILATQETVTSDSFKQGLADYVNSAGTLSQNVASAVSNTFNRLEDSFVEFIQTGKFNFKEFTKSILEDLQRIIIRQLVIRNLANALGGAIGGNTGAAITGGATPNAKGNAFGRSGIIPFASGGVVNSPTMFGFGGGKTGLMGEAGPEAILPLTRSSTGDLGVKATPSNVSVNIVNATPNSEVSQRESTDSFGNKTIDIIIHSKVKEGINSGLYDKTFKQTFGLDRKGL